jgi:hypothetical protein
VEVVSVARPAESVLVPIETPFTRNVTSPVTSPVAAPGVTSAVSTMSSPTGACPGLIRRVMFVGAGTTTGVTVCESAVVVEPKNSQSPV